MSSLNCSLHFYTLKQIGYEESNVAVTSYHDRTHFETNNTYAFYAEEFHLQQGRKFTLHNKLATLPSKMSKFKDQIKELDDLFTNSKPVIKTTSEHANKETLNHFLACFSSSIAKIIWLESNRLLLVLNDSNLIWILFDTVSGDLIKLKIDKSLASSLPLFNSQTSSTSSAKHAHLSGQLISDAALILHTDSASLVLAYSDAPKVDIVKLNKSSLGYFKANKNEQTLKKLNAFEPQLKTHEFALPSQYFIEKKLCTHASNETFTVWWENSSGMATSLKQENEQFKSISLLDRDDLRHNIQILSLSLKYDNLLEYVFKSEGNLLALSYLTKTSLVAIEQAEDLKSRQFLINIYRYNLPDDLNVEAKNSLKIKLISFELTSKIVSSEQVAASKNSILMLTSDQSLIIYEINRNAYRSHRLVPNEDYVFNGVEWLVDDLLFCVTNINGDLEIFDIGFNALKMTYMNRESAHFGSLGQYLNKNLFARFSNSNRKFEFNKNCFQRIRSARELFADSLWSFFFYSHGPVGVFRVCLTENFNPVSLVSLYLKSSLHAERTRNLENAVKLACELDWDREAKLVLACLNKIVNFILCEQHDVQHDSKIEQLGKRALACFFKPRKQLNEKTIYESKHHVCRLARKYFYHLLQHRSFHSAYLLAVDVGSKDLFTDLYYCALDSNETQMAEICRQTYHEMIRKKDANDLSILNLEPEEEEISEEIDANDSLYNYNNENVYDLNGVETQKSIYKSQIYSCSEIEQFAQKLANKIRI